MTSTTMNTTVVGPNAWSRTTARSARSIIVAVRSATVASSASDDMGVSFIDDGTAMSYRSRTDGAMSVRVTNPSRQVEPEVAQPVAMPGPAMANTVSWFSAAGGVGPTTITVSRSKSTR